MLAGKGFPARTQSELLQARLLPRLEPRAAAAVAAARVGLVRRPPLLQQVALLLPRLRAQLRRQAHLQRQQHPRVRHPQLEQVLGRRRPRPHAVQVPRLGLLHLTVTPLRGLQMGLPHRLGQPLSRC